MKFGTAGLYRLVVLGYILAVSMPPIGFALGIWLVVPSTSAKSKHGIWMMAVSIIAAVLWIVVLGSGALKTASTDY